MPGPNVLVASGDFRPCCVPADTADARGMTTIDADVRPERITLRDGSEIDVWTSSDDERVTVTAWTSTGDLVGLARFETAPSSHPKAADLRVSSSQRRRGIGTVLFRRLVTEAAARGITMLTWTHPADDLAVRHLEMESEAACARRVEHGRTKSTIFVPAA